LQHPTGDADRVAPESFGAGGELIFVNMQDIYQDWPYRDCGIDDYLTKMIASADGRFAFIPFNEPDWIWYDLKTADADQYIEDYAKPPELRFIPPISGILGRLATRRTK
jgi:hypothetical protein